MGFEIVKVGRWWHVMYGGKCVSTPSRTRRSAEDTVREWTRLGVTTDDEYQASGRAESRVSLADLTVYGPLGRSVRV